MRRYDENSENDKEDLKELNAEQWQVDLLKYNPSYTSWGCFEDGLSKEGGWSGRVILNDWKNRGNWELDEYNELINFYFEVYRKNHECSDCEGTGLNPKTLQISKEWYDFEETGKKWCYAITDVEVLALAKAGRLCNFIDGDNFYFDDELQKWVTFKAIPQSFKREKVVLNEMPNLPSAEEINLKAKSQKRIGHDAINKSVCVRARAEHLGVYGNCEHCQGYGYIYEDEKATVALQLWYIHPRKGASRGVYIECIEQDDIPHIIKYLKQARDRNNQRFSKL